MARRSNLKARTRAISSVVLFHNADKAEAVSARASVKTALERRGVSVTAAGSRPASSLKGCDIAIALGGDGTMLRCARAVSPYSVPLLGVNAGGLGFLSAVDLAGFRKRLPELLLGAFRVEPRWMISIEVRRDGKTVFGPHDALNDCVLRGVEQARAVTFAVESGGVSVASYFGDGLVFATPTGSTAYALAVGGPVVMPEVNAFLLAPISPHQLTSRPLLVGSDRTITARLLRRNLPDSPQAIVSVDGQIDHPLLLGDEVLIQRAARPFRLLVPPGRSHFDLLREKLKWGER